MMKRLILVTALVLLSTGGWGDFSCPNGTNAACLDHGDKVCPGSAKCVGGDVVCFDKHTCDPGGSFICESEYDDVVNDYKKAVSEHNELALKNVDLRDKRLEQKNCVLNAARLEDAKRCVR
jgi:hypothetical protein